MSFLCCFFCGRFCRERENIINFHLPLVALCLVERRKNKSGEAAQYLYISTWYSFDHNQFSKEADIYKRGRAWHERENDRSCFFWSPGRPTKQDRPSLSRYFFFFFHFKNRWNFRSGNIKHVQHHLEVLLYFFKEIIRIEWSSSLVKRYRLNNKTRI